MNRTRPLTLTGITALAVLPAMLTASAWAQSRPSGRILGYITQIPPTSAEARAARHQEVARRRAGTPILVHRGASDAAPENTLEAYAAAMDWGADGCEIDLRRSKDGVIYLHHDDELGRVLQGSGKVKDKTYYELLTAPVKVDGTANRDTRVPTLAAFLVLARQRSMLIHLDLKEPDIQDEIEKMLDRADMWDHVVEVNAYNSERLRAHPKVKLLSYKGWWPEGNDAENPASIRHFLDLPGVMAISKDPRPAVRWMKREVPKRVPLPKEVRAWWEPDGILADQAAPVASSQPASPRRQD